jgi:lysophospholipase
VPVLAAGGVPQGTPPAYFKTAANSSTPVLVELYGLDSNPVPEGAEAGTVVASDGVALRFARFPTTARRPLGTVCLLQGRTECIEKYFEVAGELRRRGFGVATLDWRGQGGSERRLRNRRKGHVDSFEEYDRDIDAFMEQVVLPDCPPPYYALAHSTGGLILLRAARDSRARFTRMVLNAPLLGLARSRPSPEFGFRLAAVLAALGLGELDVSSRVTKTIDKMRFEGNPLTSDPDRFARNRDIVVKLPELAVGPPTFAWLYAATLAMRQTMEPEFGPAIRIPTLIISAGADRIVSLRAIEAVAAELRVGGQVVIPGAQHEVLMERDVYREQFWAAFDAFIPGTQG